MNILTTNKKIAVFFHVATLNNYIEIKNDILKAIHDSDLFININELFICETNGDNYEFPTLNKLYDFCKYNNNYYILYIHTKGVSKPNNINIKNWRNYLIEFNINRWKTIIELFNTTDINTIGVNFKKTPEHFSGNFWWATSEYISNLNNIENSPYFSHRPNEERYKCETWLLTGNYKSVSLCDIPFSDKFSVYNVPSTLKNNIKIYLKSS